VLYFMGGTDDPVAELVLSCAAAMAGSAMRAIAVRVIRFIVTSSRVRGSVAGTW
jgi:hypothetical protein